MALVTTPVAGHLAGHLRGGNVPQKCPAESPPETRSGHGSCPAQTPGKPALARLCPVAGHCGTLRDMSRWHLAGQGVFPSIGGKPHVPMPCPDALSRAGKSS